MKSLKLLIMTCVIPFLTIGCLVNQNPEGNPLDPNNLDGLFLINQLYSQFRSTVQVQSTPTDTASAQLNLTAFNHGLQIKSVTKNGSSIYGLVDIISTTLSYQIFRSTDGISFSAIGVPFVSSSSSLNRIVSIDNKIIVFTSGSRSSYFYSDNLGASWSTVNSTYTPFPFSSESWNCLLANNTTLFSMFQSQYYTSLDNGANFTNPTPISGVSNRTSTYCARENDIYYLVGGRVSGSSTSDILVSSTTTPTTWTNANNGNLGTIASTTASSSTSCNSSVSELAFTAINASTWVVANSFRISHTTDSGSTWECRSLLWDDNSNTAFRAGFLTNIGNRVFGYGSPNNNPTKGYYFDL